MLEHQINETLKQALKEGDKTKLSVFRMILSSIKNKKIDDGVKELDDDKVIALIQKKARQHQESMKQFEEGGRQDLVEKEATELKYLEEYLPEQLAEEEVTKIVEEVIAETGASSVRDMGKVMGKIMPRVKGKADGNLINKIVSSRLAQ